MNTRHTDSGDITVTAAEVVVSAIGILEEPRYPPDLKGVFSFRGDAFHSARWNHNIDLDGKRVAVIGNGCSAYVSVIHSDHDLTS